MKGIEKLFPNGVPEKITLTISQVGQQTTFSKDFEIPIIVQN